MLLFDWLSISLANQLREDRANCGTCSCYNCGSGLEAEFGALEAIVGQFINDSFQGLGAAKNGNSFIWCRHSLHFPISVIVDND